MSPRVRVKRGGSGGQSHRADEPDRHTDQHRRPPFPGPVSLALDKLSAGVRLTLDGGSGNGTTSDSVPSGVFYHSFPGLAPKQSVSAVLTFLPFPQSGPKTTYVDYAPRVLAGEKPASRRSGHGPYRGREKSPRPVQAGGFVPSGAAALAGQHREPAEAKAEQAE